MSCPPAIMAKLQMQRETLMHGQPVQTWVAEWWKHQLPDDRRTLLALSGLDDSIENARRPWQQYTLADRDKLLFECKRFARLVEAVRWA